MRRTRTSRLAGTFLGLLLTLTIAGNVFAVAKAWKSGVVGDPSAYGAGNGALHSAR